MSKSNVVNSVSIVYKRFYYNHRLWYRTDFFINPFVLIEINILIPNDYVISELYGQFYEIEYDFSGGKRPPSIIFIVRFEKTNMLLDILQCQNRLIGRQPLFSYRYNKTIY